MAALATVGKARSSKDEGLRLPPFLALLEAAGKRHSEELAGEAFSGVPPEKASTAP
ncbi:MAG: hypothetical protein O3C21_20080 [Verrucomicrobia bacterium]|nr:hypothetical protein [Verrucomicrobiota bacterium]